MNYIAVADLIGITMASVEQQDDERINFTSNDGRMFVMYHSQDCCESVYIESIVGNLQDLVGEPILRAEEVTHEGSNPEGVDVPEWQDDSYTWTFYKFATRKGYVDIRWYGESNGYYSESVDLYEIAAEAPNTAGA
ncbi:DUF7448 domain-containing protein [Ralstonia syzygii]|uniref:DUF7448 domain-containing protein n=1 Tax=Ralstonia syzygii TaxID=28097 RepID=UPI0018D074E6|nr:hypothetical protein [Ralstonia syzygii]